MSVLASSISTNNIGNANVGTATTGDNSTNIASGNFLFNTFNALNYVLNFTTSSIVTGVKTFTNGFIIGGTNALFPITLGTIRASIIDILPPSLISQNVTVMGQTQSLTSNYGTNVFINPIVVKDENNKITTGTIVSGPSGSTVTFINPYNNVPLVFINPSFTSTPINCGVFDVTSAGFKAYSTSNQNCRWFAIGS